MSKTTDRENHDINNATNKYHAFKMGEEITFFEHLFNSLNDIKFYCIDSGKVQALDNYFNLQFKKIISSLSKLLDQFKSINISNNKLQTLKSTLSNDFNAIGIDHDKIQALKIDFCASLRQAMNLLCEIKNSIFYSNEVGGFLGEDCNTIEMDEMDKKSISKNVATKSSYARFGNGEIDEDITSINLLTKLIDQIKFYLNDNHIKANNKELGKNKSTFYYPSSDNEINKQLQKNFASNPLFSMTL